MLHIKDPANEMKRHTGWRSTSVVIVMSHASFLIYIHAVSATWLFAWRWPNGLLIIHVRGNRDVLKEPVHETQGVSNCYSVNLRKFKSNVMQHVNMPTPVTYHLKCQTSAGSSFLNVWLCCFEESSIIISRKSLGLDCSIHHLQLTNGISLKTVNRMIFLWKHLFQL